MQGHILDNTKILDESLTKNREEKVHLDDSKHANSDLSDKILPSLRQSAKLNNRASQVTEQMGDNQFSILVNEKAIMQQEQNDILVNVTETISDFNEIPAQLQSAFDKITSVLDAKEKNREMQSLSIMIGCVSNEWEHITDEQKINRMYSLKNAANTYCFSHKPKPWTRRAIKRRAAVEQLQRVTENIINQIDSSSIKCNETKEEKVAFDLSVNNGKDENLRVLLPFYRIEKPESSIQYKRMISYATIFEESYNQLESFEKKPIDKVLLINFENYLAALVTYNGKNKDKVDEIIKILDKEKDNENYPQEMRDLMVIYYTRTAKDIKENGLLTMA